MYMMILLYIFFLGEYENDFLIKNYFDRNCIIYVKCIQYKINSNSLFIFQKLDVKFFNLKKQKCFKYIDLIWLRKLLIMFS